MSLRHLSTELSNNLLAFRFTKMFDDAPFINTERTIFILADSMREKRFEILSQLVDFGITDRFICTCRRRRIELERRGC